MVYPDCMIEITYTYFPVGHLSCSLYIENINTIKFRFTTFSNKLWYERLLLLRYCIIWSSSQITTINLKSRQFRDLLMCSNKGCSQIKINIFYYKHLMINKNKTITYLMVYKLDSFCFDREFHRLAKIFGHVPPPPSLFANFLFHFTRLAK